MHAYIVYAFKGINHKREKKYNFYLSFFQHEYFVLFY